MHASHAVQSRQSSLETSDGINLVASKIRDKSTSGNAQRVRILQALCLRAHTSYELRKLGCYQAPARIIELRRQGHKISTKRVTIWDDEGFRHDGVALYTLHEKKIGTHSLDLQHDHCKVPNGGG